MENLSADSPGLHVHSHVGHQIYLQDFIPCWIFNKQHHYKFPTYRTYAVPLHKAPNYYFILKMGGTGSFKALVPAIPQISCFNGSF
jgi:hypothetical protein